MVGQIKIEGKTYPLKFGYGAIKQLGLLWDVELGEVFPKFDAAFKGMQNNLKYEHVDVIGELVLAGILNANKHVEIEIDSDDIVQDLIFNERSEELTRVSKLFFDSMPKDLKGTQPAKKKPAKKTPNKRKKKA